MGGWFLYRQGMVREKGGGRGGVGQAAYLILFSCRYAQVERVRGIEEGGTVPTSREDAT